MIQNAGIPGVFLVSLISGSSIFFFPVADFVYIPLAVSAGLDAIGVGLAAGLATAIGELTAYGVGRLSKNMISLDRFMSKRRRGLPAHTVYFSTGRWIKRNTDPGDWTARFGFWAIPIFAFSPLPMDLLGLVLGYLRYNPGKFFVGALIGKVPRCLLLAYGLTLFRVPPVALLVAIAAVGAAILTTKWIRL